MSLPNLRVVARIKPNDTTETGPDRTVDSHLRLCLPFHTELRTQPSTDRHLLGHQPFLCLELRLRNGYSEQQVNYFPSTKGGR